MMRRLRWLIALTLCPLLGASTAHSWGRRSNSIPHIGPIDGFHKITDGYVFTEGPAVDKFGHLYFTDTRTRGGKIYRLDPWGRVFLFRAPSGRANGLSVNPQGKIVACQMDGRIVAYSPDGCHMRVIASGFNGRRFNAPNDLVIDKYGGIYFTDPYIHGPCPFRPQREAVYYISPDGQTVTRLIDNLRSPNGIALSPDGTTLYVVSLFRRDVHAYRVIWPGVLGPRHVFCQLARSFMPIYVGGDGATVDQCGNVYIATQRGVQVFNRCGRSLGILRLPQLPSNVTFGGPDGRTLIITARSAIYAGRMCIPGCR